MSPRTEKQFEEIRQSRRQMIMGTALELFALNGYDNTSIAQIAKKAGISKGLMYNYFEGKDELLDTILNQGVDAMVQKLDPNKDGVLEDFELEYFISATFDMITENKDFWKLFFSINLQTSVFQHIEKRIAELNEPVMKLMVDYLAKAGYKNPVIEAILFGAAIRGISLSYVMKPEIMPIEALKNELIERYCKNKHCQTAPGL